MNDDELELANAYLDGEATADERALVESDAELLAELQRLRTVRAALGHVDPPVPATRESAIAAALAVFDERASVAAPAAAAAAAPTNVVPIERRRRLRRMQGLSAAAAVIVIVGGGYAITQRDDGDGAGDATQQQDSVVVLEAPVVSQPVASPATDPDVAPDLPGESMSATTPTTVAAETADAAAADVAISTDDEVAEIEPGAQSESANPPAAAAPMTTVLVRQVVVRDEDDLIALADSMKSTPVDLDDAEDACATGTLKADAVVEADDGTQRSIVVVAIEVDDHVDLGALSLGDCEIVLRASVPAADGA